MRKLNYAITFCHISYKLNYFEQSDACWSMETLSAPAVDQENDGAAAATPPPRTNRENMIVRLTGDWSDTGPSAVPNTAPSEAGEY
mgnify:FL=1